MPTASDQQHVTGRITDTRLSMPFGGGSPLPAMEILKSQILACVNGGIVDWRRFTCRRRGGASQVKFYRGDMATTFNLMTVQRSEINHDNAPEPSVVVVRQGDDDISILELPFAVSSLAASVGSRFRFSTSSSNHPSPSMRFQPHEELLQTDLSWLSGVANRLLSLQRLG
jgi:hypothetical protein